MGIAAFWNLLGQSRLVPAEQIQQLSEAFQAEHPGLGDDATDQLVEWLVSRNALTKYQAAVLKAGRSGPFQYGDYRVFDRLKNAPRQGTFRAVHEPSGFQVLLRFASAQESADWPRIAAQIDQHARTSNPYLVRCYEPVDLVQFRFAVMSGAGQGTLADEIKSKTRLSAVQACGIAWQIAQAIQAIHESGLPHGDIRPTTVLLEDGGKALLWRDPIKSPGTLFTSGNDGDELAVRARYMAPELAAQGKSFDTLTDIYALGCLFYEMLAGKPPFAGADVMSLMQAHASQPIQPLDALGVPAPIAQMVAYMMAKKPDLRYQQMSIVVDQLRAFVDEAKTSVPLPDPAEDRFISWTQQKRQTLAAQAPAPSFPQVSDVPQVPQVHEPAADHPPIDTGPGTPTSPKASLVARKRKSPVKLIAIATTVLLFLGGAIGVWALMSGPDGNGNGDDQTAQNGSGDADEQNGTSGDGGPTTTDVTATNRQVLIEDDGQALWETPTLGAPIDVEHMAGGLRMLSHLRPSELFAGTEGQVLRRAFGPDFESTLAELEDLWGVRLDEISSLLIGFHDNAGQAPRASYRIELNQNVPRDTLLQRWGSPTEQSVEGGQTYWLSSTGMAFLPIDMEDDAVLRFLVGVEEDVAAVATVGGAPPVIRRELRALLASSDQSRHASILIIPHSLFNDEGRQLFTGALSKLVKPLETLIGDGVGAGMISAHRDQDLYLEIMLKGKLDIEPQLLAEQFESRLRTMLNDLSSYVFGLGTNPYWDRLRMRFDNWVNLAQSNLRSGVENNTVVLNCWLPGPAAANFAVAGELALASAPGQVFQASAPTENASLKDIRELLDTRFTIEIPRNDLVLIVEEIKQTIRNEHPGISFPMDIKLMGKDLELGQITQNQSVNDFSMVDKPLSEILTQLMVKANPDSSTTGPADPKTKMVWVVAENPDQAGEQIILITTRTAAKEREYDLPPEFRISE